MSLDDEQQGYEDFYFQNIISAYPDNQVKEKSLEKNKIYELDSQQTTNEQIQSLTTKCTENQQQQMQVCGQQQKLQIDIINNEKPDQQQNKKEKKSQFRKYNYKKMLIQVEQQYQKPLTQEQDELFNNLSIKQIKKLGHNFLRDFMRQLTIQIGSKTQKKTGQETIKEYIIKDEIVLELIKNEVEKIIQTKHQQNKQKLTNKIIKYFCKAYTHGHLYNSYLITLEHCFIDINQIENIKKLGLKNKQIIAIIQKIFYKFFHIYMIFDVDDFLNGNYLIHQKESMSQDERDLLWFILQSLKDDLIDIFKSLQKIYQ